MYCEMSVGPAQGYWLQQDGGLYGLRLAFRVDIRAILNVNMALTAAWHYFTDDYGLL